MSNPAIVVDSVSKSFRKNLVLRDVSLRVEPGRTYAFLGRNGAGKTTTIRLLLGLLKRDAGGIRVLGIDPHRRSAHPARPRWLSGRRPSDVLLDAGR